MTTEMHINNCSDIQKYTKPKRTIHMHIHTQAEWMHKHTQTHTRVHQNEKYQQVVKIQNGNKIIAKKEMPSSDAFPFCPLGMA